MFSLLVTQHINDKIKDMHACTKKKVEKSVYMDQSKHVYTFIRTCIVEFLYASTL